MINVNDLMSKFEYDSIMSQVEKREDFEFRKDYKKFNFYFHSGHFSCDGKDFKDGDYYVGLSINKKCGNYAGCGMPMSLSNFLNSFSTYENAKSFLISNIQNYCDEQIIDEVENEQLTLF